MTGPSAPPPPATAAHAPIARARSFGSRKTLVSNDSVAGMMSAAPMPMNARVNTSAVADPANAEDAEPRQKIASPVLSARLRPMRSPRLPVVRSRPANTSV